MLTPRTQTIEPTILDDRYMLVSDSNETSTHFDSKKLCKDDFVEMAQENLFRKHLNIMSRYLTKAQFETYKQVIERSLTLQQQVFSQINTSIANRKLKPVDGQVILIDSAQFDAWNAGQTPKKSLVEYVKLNWDITSDFTVTQIKDCMLRGVTEIDSLSQNQIKKASNQRVGLTEANIPVHMHHSGVTTDADIKGLQGSSANADKTGAVEDGTRYDMFYNDSFATGLDYNEMDGTVDTFNVQSSGVADQSDSSTNKVFHANMPNYRKFYAFVVRKNST